MEKSIYTDEYGALLALLRAARREAGLTQVQLAQKLGQSQSFVSKVEKGDRRLDLIQLRTICHALGTTLPQFVQRLEEELGQPGKRRPRSRPSS
jgi:transcriptional regulator with XRE-family HTH domain